MTRVMKSYFGAMAVNISRISRVSWRSTGVPMIRFAVNLTRISARESELILGRSQPYTCGPRKQSRQLLLRRVGLFAHLACHLMALRLNRRSLAAVRAGQQAFGM